MATAHALLVGMSCVLLAAATSFACAGEPQTHGAVLLENENTRIVFDLDRGVYAAEDKATGAVLFRNATMEVQTAQGTWMMSDPKAVGRSARVTDVSDAMGPGRMLRVTTKHDAAELQEVDEGRIGVRLVTMPDAVELELDILLYQGRSGIVFSCGYRNRCGQAVLVRGFCPMLDADLFPGDPEKRNPLTLDGSAAHGENSVQPGLYRESQNNLLLTYLGCGTRRSAVLGGLTYYEWVKTAGLAGGPGGSVLATMRASDPVGRMVDAKTEYRSTDRFYADFQTADPFAAMEQYGQAVAMAQDAKPNLYEFPTVCSWYIQFTGGAQRRDTVEAVKQMDIIKSTGFLKYTPVAMRLVPAKYCYKEPWGLTEQGWWDDEHWRKWGSYKEPYDTSEKFCRAIRERGGLPFTYLHTGMPSDDFARAHPNWMLFNSIRYLPLRHAHDMPYVRMDYSDPGFQQHMRKVWKNLGEAGMAGVMFDYPETAWAAEGGLEDVHSTMAAAYRKVFELAREGLGPQAYLHERNVGDPGSATARPDQYPPFSDITVGVVDSQRVEGDNPLFTVEQVQRCALRWYKTRRLYMYDMDGKSLLFRRIAVNAAVETETVSNPAVFRRAILTMLYVTAGRVLVTDSFKDYTPEILHDLSRLFPTHSERQTARPVDAFLPSARRCPRVFDFVVSPEWHQVTLFNADSAKKVKVTAPLSGESVSQGALGLDREAEYYVYDFWNDRLVGRILGTDRLEQEVAPSEARMLSVHKVASHPQFLSTNRHLMQGYVDMPGRPRWDAAMKTLSGLSKVVAGESYRIVLAGNGWKAISVRAEGARSQLESHPQGDGLQIIVIECGKNADVAWQAVFQPYPTGMPTK